MKYILILLLLMITACTTTVIDETLPVNNVAVEEDIVMPEEEPEEILSADADTEHQELPEKELSEDEIAYKELERILNIFSDPDHDAVGEDKIAELQLQLINFDNKGFEVQPLWDLFDIVSEKSESLIYQPGDEPVQTCISNPNPVFTHAFTDTSKIDKISPSGFWMTEDIFKGHSFVWTEGENVPVYAPTNMKLTGGAYYRENNKNQYVLYFEVSCEVSLKFDHIHEPIGEITELLSNLKEDTRSEETESLAFKAGDLIAHTRGNHPSGNWDIGVYNYNKPNNIPDLVHDADKHADCPFDYYQDNVYEDLYVEDSLLCKS